MNVDKWFQKLQKDLHPTRRHYDYSPYCSANDIDGIMTSRQDIFSNNLIEIAQGEPLAIVEYKFGGPNPNGNQPTFNLLDDEFYTLSFTAQNRRGTLPVFLNIFYYYKSDGTFLNSWDSPLDLSLLAHAQHLIIGINEIAVKKLNNNKLVKMTEEQYAKFLCKMKNIAYQPSDPLYTTFRKIKSPTIHNLSYTYKD